MIKSKYPPVWIYIIIKTKMLLTVTTVLVLCTNSYSIRSYIVSDNHMHTHDIPVATTCDVIASSWILMQGNMTEDMDITSIINRFITPLMVTHPLFLKRYGNHKLCFIIFNHLEISLNIFYMWEIAIRLAHPYDSFPLSTH